MQGNWSATAQAVTDHLPIHAAGTETPFTALGSARVGLGRDRFRDYAAEHLARAAVERVLRRHEELRLPDDERIPRRLVADVAQDVFGAFLAASGLDERGDGAHDILDGLRPENQAALARALADTLHRRVAEGVGERGLSAVEVRHRILTETAAREPGFRDELRLARHARGRDWVAWVQRRLSDHTARFLAVHGGPVTATVLGMLATELGRVREELRETAARHQRWALGREQAVAQEVDRGGATLTGASPAILAGVRRAVDVLLSQDEAELREMAAALLPDLVDNLLEPLRAAVERGTAALAQEEVSPVDGRPSPIALWPVGDAVPERLRPAPNEFLLEPTTAYPRILADLVTRTVEAGGPGGRPAGGGHPGHPRRRRRRGRRAAPAPPAHRLGAPRGRAARRRAHGPVPGGLRPRRLRRGAARAAPGGGSAGRAPPSGATSARGCATTSTPTGPSRPSTPGAWRPSRARSSPPSTPPPRW